MRLYGVLFLSFILCGSPVFGAGRLAKKGVKGTDLLQARKIKKLEKIKKVGKKEAKVGTKNKKGEEVKGKVKEKKRKVRERAGRAGFVRGRPDESTVLSRAASQLQQTEQRVRAREAAAKKERFPYQMVRVEREAREKAKALAKVEAAKVAAAEVAEALKRARLEQKKARARVLRVQLQEKLFDAQLEKYQEKLRNLASNLGTNLGSEDKILKLIVNQSVDQRVAPEVDTFLALSTVGVNSIAIDNIDSVSADNTGLDSVSIDNASADNTNIDSVGVDGVGTDSMARMHVASIDADNSLDLEVSEKHQLLTNSSGIDGYDNRQYALVPRSFYAESQRSQSSPFSPYSQDKIPESYKCEKPSCLKNGKHTCLRVMVESAHCWPELPEKDQKENPALMITFDKEAVRCESKLLKSCTVEVEHEQSTALSQVFPVSRVFPISKRKNQSFQAGVPARCYSSFARFQDDGVLEAPRPSLFRAISTAYLYKAHLYKTWRDRKDREALARTVVGKSDELTSSDAYAEARLRALRCAQGVGFSNYAGILAALQSPLEYNRQLARSFLVDYTYNPVSVLL